MLCLKIRNLPHREASSTVLMPVVIQFNNDLIIVNCEILGCMSTSVYLYKQKDMVFYSNKSNLFKPTFFSHATALICDISNTLRFTQLSFNCCEGKHLIALRGYMDLEQLRARNSHLMAVLNYIIFIPVKNRKGSDRPESHALVVNRHNLHDCCFVFLSVSQKTSTTGT